MECPRMSTRPAGRVRRVGIQRGRGDRLEARVASSPSRATNPPESISACSSRLRSNTTPAPPPCAGLTGMSTSTPTRAGSADKSPSTSALFEEVTYFLSPSLDSLLSAKVSPHRSNESGVGQVADPPPAWRRSLHSCLRTEERLHHSINRTKLSLRQSRTGSASSRTPTPIPSTSGGRARRTGPTACTSYSYVHSNHLLVSLLGDDCRARRAQAFVTRPPPPSRREAVRQSLTLSFQSQPLWVTKSIDLQHAQE